MKIAGLYGSADFQVCCIGGFPNPHATHFSAPRRFGNRRHSRFGNLRHGFAQPGAGRSIRNFVRGICLLFALCVVNASAMDRWTALAMLETGGNDRAVGKLGEISRFQIRPELWPGGNPLDRDVALANAQQIMSPRVAIFEQSSGRSPNDFEFYVLWNAPAQIDHPGRAVTERARRFANLVTGTSPILSSLAFSLRK